MEAYINGQCAISPQNTFAEARPFTYAKEYDEVRFLKCIEPKYSEFIDPMISRRMSRIMKMGVSAAMKCLNEASIKVPDAIIAGTGLGCLEDTEKFLSSVFSGDEKLLNPTPFIQSTHNTVTANIAILLRCNNYNNTYSHRGFSFEAALLDAMMLLNEGAANNVLVGGVDELTPTLFRITERLGYWRRKAINNLNLQECNENGSIAGEGTTFFALSKLKTDTSLAKIRSVETFYKPESITETQKKLSDFLKSTTEGSDKPDLVLMGINGDIHSDQIYHTLRQNIFRDIPCAYFKHLCGEYDTASSFGLFLAASIIKDQTLPGFIRLDNKPVERLRKILIYNHRRNIHHTLIMLSVC